MQFSSILMALAASTVSAQTVNNAVANANANGNINSTVSDVSAVANAGNVAPAPVPTYTAPDGHYPDQPEYPGNPGYPDHPGYPGCTTTSTHGATLTITDLTVSTYCPVCDEAKTNGDVYTTTYETVYQSVCPTGLTSVTYTVTQTCTGTTPIDYATPAPGYEVVTTVCDHCPNAPTYTVTQPCNSCAQTPYVTPYATPYATAGNTPYPPMVTYTGSASTVAISFAGVFTIFIGMLLL